MVLGGSIKINFSSWWWWCGDIDNCGGMDTTDDCDVDKDDHKAVL